MQPLPADTLHIHLLRPNEYVDTASEKILNMEERQQALAFRFQRDRDLYMAAHLFLRRVLSRYAPIPPDGWQFSRNAYGKPAIANSAYGWLQFNLSHTHGLVACAVARDCAVGVDVEGIRNLSDLPGLCQYAFAPVEMADVLNAPSQQEQTERFFSYWTLKEAYIKARGLGLSLPLQQFAFQCTTGHWQLHCEPTLQAGGEHWQSDTIRIGAHCLAYCVQRGCSDSQSSKVWITVENSPSKVAWNSAVEITAISC